MKRIAQQEGENRKLLENLSEYDSRMSEMDRGGIPHMEVKRDDVSKLGCDFEL